MSDLFFSIVIPTYNRAHLIVATLDSIRLQTFTLFEVIIVDDGSNDNTETIVLDYISRYNLKENWGYFKKENGERAAARNFGTQLAKGKFINWFDSDDLMKPNHLLQIEQNIIELKDIRIIASGYRLQNLSGKTFSIQNRKGIFNNLIYKGNYFACSPVFVERELAESEPFCEDRDLSGSEDYELWLRLAAKTEIFCTGEMTVSIIQHDDRSVRTMSNKVELIERFTRFIQYTTENEQIIHFLGDKLSYFKMKNYLLLSVELAVHNHKSEARHFLKKAVSASWKAIFQRSFYATIKHLIF